MGRDIEKKTIRFDSTVRNLGFLSPDVLVVGCGDEEHGLLTFINLNPSDPEIIKEFPIPKTQGPIRNLIVSRPITSAGELDDILPPDATGLEKVPATTILVETGAKDADGLEIRSFSVRVLDSFRGRGKVDVEIEENNSLKLEDGGDVEGSGDRLIKPHSISDLAILLSSHAPSRLTLLTLSDSSVDVLGQLTPTEISKTIEEEDPSTSSFDSPLFPPTAKITDLDLHESSDLVTGSPLYNLSFSLLHSPEVFSLVLSATDGHIIHPPRIQTILPRSTPSKPIYIRFLPQRSNTRVLLHHDCEQKVWKLQFRRIRGEEVYVASLPKAMGENVRALEIVKLPAVGKIEQFVVAVAVGTGVVIYTFTRMGEGGKGDVLRHYGTLEDVYPDGAAVTNLAFAPVKPHTFPSLESAQSAATQSSSTTTENIKDLPTEFLRLASISSPSQSHKVIIHNLPLFETKAGKFIRPPSDWGFLNFVVSVVGMAAVGLLIQGAFGRWIVGLLV